MKASEVKQMSAAELDQRLAQLKEELFNLRFQLATGQLENPMNLKQVKRDIARVKTVMRERELQEKAAGAQA